MTRPLRGPITRLARTGEQLLRPAGRRLFYALAVDPWLREGTTRRVWFGPYRGLAFELAAPLMGRRNVFYRAYEPAVTRWLRRTIRPGMVVWDVGAHVGIHALYVAHLLKGQGQVVAFEGWPANAACLRRNVAANPRLSALITLVPQCIARQAGPVHMAEGSADGKHHLATGDEAQSVEVQATTLDDFWRETGTCPDILILDIEGYELDALEGGIALLQRCRPRLVVEHHQRAEALRGWLAAQQYAIESADDRHIFAR
jgi:FkbM family methyltransferase